MNLVLRLRSLCCRHRSALREIADGRVFLACPDCGWASVGWDLRRAPTSGKVLPISISILMAADQSRKRA